MTQTAIHKDLSTIDQIGTDNLETGPIGSWIPEQPTRQEDQKNLISKIPSIDTIENENLAREKQISETLDEIREEVKETCEIDSEVRPVPEQAYEETHNLLKRIDSDVPVPDIMWLERGGIGLQWSRKNSIVTMSLYGDNHVNYVAILGERYEIAVTCPLSDELLLPDFLKTLSTLFEKRV